MQKSGLQKNSFDKLTYEEWNRLGYTIKFGEVPVCKNEKKKGVFDFSQVIKKLDY